MCTKPSFHAITTGPASSQIAPGKSNSSASISYNPSPPSARRSNRRYLVFCAFLLTLLVGSSLLHASSSIPTVNLQVASLRRTSFSASIQLLSAAEVVEEFSAVQAGAEHDALRCNRSHFRTDVCVARGDVRVVGGTELHSRRTYQVVVLTEGGPEMVERVRPYTRKWEESVMKTIDEVQIIRRRRNSGDSGTNSAVSPRNQSGSVDRSIVSDDHRELPLQHKDRHTGNRARIISRLQHAKPITRLRSDNYTWQSNLDHSQSSEVPRCEVQHNVPAILFSTGGYTGNVYHEFNDGLIPLFITARQHAIGGQVVLILLEYHSWWMSKYAEVVEQMTNYTVIDLGHDERVHCFPEVAVGLQIHGELCIDSDNDNDNDNEQGAPYAASMKSFQAMLRAAYGSRSTPENAKEIRGARAVDLVASVQRPKLVIISRREGSRVLINEEEIVRIATEMGFAVQVLSPTPSSRMVDMYEAVSGCDAMLGVHGAAMTHLVFMRPGATFIQVVPLGTAWAAATYYGEPARKLGLNYVQYKVTPQESSLWGRYSSFDPVLRDPDSVTRKVGWWETKRIYLQAQNLTLSLPTIAATLRSVYQHHHRSTSNAIIL